MLISVPLLSLVRLLLNLEAAKARGLAEMLRSSTIFIMVEIHGDVYLYITYIYMRIYVEIHIEMYGLLDVIGCWRTVMVSPGVWEGLWGLRPVRTFRYFMIF